MRIVEKSILMADQQYICHQCNCVSTKTAGLAKKLFEIYPWANSYLQRKEPSILGTIQIFNVPYVSGDEPQDNVGIINMYAQYYPGIPNQTNDSNLIRLNSFIKCLKCIIQIPELKSLAFPYKIGCGLAGGNWEQYENLLQKFSNLLKHIDIVLYKV